MSQKIFSTRKSTRVQLRASLILAFAMALSGVVWAQGEKRPALPSFNYDEAYTHEIKPHRRTIPTEGIVGGMNQLRLRLTVSPAGDVIGAEASGDQKLMKYWPLLQIEVRAWRFTPFEENGKAVTAEVEEYIDLVPPERLPANHAVAPMVRADSKVAITLKRTGCFGSCPSYTVTVGTEGIVFVGEGFVAASGKHTARVDADDVRKLAKRFVAADFYSMDGKYEASVTDMPGFVLSVEIDGRKKEVVDYVGEWVGMPAVISELENEVDAFAQTGRWIGGSDGLFEALRAEEFDFRTYGAQVMLKEAASRGNAQTVRDFLKAGVPLKVIAAPKQSDPNIPVPSYSEGWLQAASRHADVIQVLVEAGASKNDQKDKDLALVDAADAGNLESARALIAYGANPNVDLSKLTMTEILEEKETEVPIGGSVLISAAASGNPEMVREILRYHPNLELRDREGRTAIFRAAEWRYRDKDSARVECVRMLAEVGANVNASDKDGNTALHETFLTDVAEELLRFGADLNARNKDGETPIFTNVDDKVVQLLVERGADLTIRNKKAQTVLEAAKSRGPARKKALLEAIEKMKKEKQ